MTYLPFCRRRRTGPEAVPTGGRMTIGARFAATTAVAHERAIDTIALQRGWRPTARGRLLQALLSPTTLLARRRNQLGVR